MSSIQVQVKNGVVLQEPTMKTVGSTSLLTLNVGAKRVWYDKAKTKHEEPNYIEVKIWGQAADKAAQEVVKFSRITCFGRLDMDSWDDKQTGKKRYKHCVVIEFPEWDNLTILPPFEFEEREPAAQKNRPNAVYEPDRDDDEIPF